MTSATWKRDFASGLIILMPLLVTAYIIYWFYSRLAGIPLPIEVAPVEVGAVTIHIQSPLRVVLTLVIFVLLVFSIGYLMRTAFGDFVEEALDGIMNRVPGLRVVYNASKMAVETAVSGTDELQEPVKLETWNGLRMTAFKTGKQTPDGKDVLFLPTAPNITTGFVIEVDPERYSPTGERVEDALTRILSAGFGDANEEPLPVDLGDGTDAGSDDGVSAESATESTTD
jgi:uncharacterized membrane protein